MVFYNLGFSYERGIAGIKAKVEYDSVEVYYNPQILKENNIFTLTKGKKKYDILRYEDPINFAMSEKLKAALEDENITGWECYPIVIEGLDEKHFGFHVTGKGGVVLNRDEYGAVSTSEPLEWNETQWDGSDMFNIPDTGITAITPRVKEVLDRFKAKNLFIDLL